MTHAFAMRDHSALVVTLPELEPVVGQWRSRYDAAVSGVPAHVTILVPWVPPAEITAVDLDAVGQLAKSWAPFSVTFRDFGIFENRNGPDVCWLSPEPVDEFLGLIDDVSTCWPEYPLYDGAHGAEVVPHLTVSSTASAVELEDMVAAVRAELPITTTATALTVLDVRDAQCAVRSSSRFGGKQR